jgi:hypothetical protein
MTRALMDIYRGDADDVTLLAVHVADSTGNDLKLEWTTIGVEPESFTVRLDGNPILENTFELAASIPMSDLSPGEHLVSVTANRVGTRYELSKMQYDVVSEELMPVVVENKILID